MNTRRAPYRGERNAIRDQLEEAAQQRPLPTSDQPPPYRGDDQRATAAPTILNNQADTSANTIRGPPQIELWDRKTVLAFFGGSKPINVSTLYKGVASGRYPKPVNVAANTVRWIADECRAALDRMIDERDTRKRVPRRDSIADLTVTAA